MASSFDPFRLETAYQHLTSDLRRPSSPRWKLARIARFLHTLPIGATAAEPYVLDVAPALAHLSASFSPIGWSAQSLHAFLDRLVQVQAAVPMLGDSWDEAIHNVRRATARLYAYAGAPDRACQVLQGNGTRSLHADLPDTTPRERLRACLQHESLSEEVHEQLQDIEMAWSRLPLAPVPVVEQLPGEDGAPHEAQDEAPRVDAVGGLLEIHVDLFGQSDDEDVLTIEGYGDATSRLNPPLLEPVCGAARAYLERFNPTLAVCRWDGRVRVLGDTTVMGASLHLALAVHLVTAMQQRVPQRVRLEPRATVAFTGALDGEGTVQPVADATLPTKVTTAFFSPVTTLVVPATQAEAAQAVCDAHRTAFPHGRLEIVGVENIADVYRDRGLTRRNETGRLQHAVNVARARSTLAVGSASGVLILILLGIIGWMAYGPIDKNPVTVRFGGEHMFLQNANGQVVDRVRIGSQAVEHYRSGKRAYTLVDADGNAQNEICWAVQEDPATRHTPDVLRCRGVGEKAERWAMPLRFEAPFPRKPEVRTSRFRAVDLQAGDLDADGRPELYLTAHHRPYFPSVLLKVDPATGEELQRYVHPGYTQSISHYDLNGDGIQELLVPGTSNAFWEATLAVLDPRDMHGHAPTQGDYTVDGLPRAHHIAYIRFPPTKVHAARTGNLNIARGIVSRDSPQQFTVGIDEGTHEDKDNGLHALVHFTSDLEPQAVGTSSEYDVIARRLVETGQLDAVPDYDYFQDYMTRLQYWTGDGWTTEPTVHWPAADSSGGR